MKILHWIEGRCAPDTANGVDKVVYYLSRAEAVEGAQVSVMCESDKDVLPVTGVNVVNIPRQRSCLSLSQDALDALEEIKPDLIHIQSAYVPTGISVARWARKKKVPYVISPHGNYSGQLATRRRWRKALYNRLFEFPCAKGAAFVHSMGDDKAIRGFGYRGLIEVVPNGFEMKSCLESSGNNVLPSEAKGKTVFLFIGRLDVEQKGLDLLFAGFAKGELDDAFLLIVGPGWRDGTERLQKLSSQLGLDQSKVQFFGSAFGQLKSDLIHASDIFVHTSRWEGFPMAVIEAMAYGKPCLVTDAADPQRTLSNHKLSISCQISEESIGSAFRKAMALDPEERRSMGSRSRSIVESQFSWEAVAKSMVAAYRKVIK